MDKVDETPKDSDDAVEAQGRREFVQSPTFWMIMSFILASVAKTVISFITLQFLRPAWARLVKWWKGENQNTVEVTVDQIEE